MPRRVSRPALAIIPVAAFLAVLPLLVRGPSCGHDFVFHLTSWLEASSQFAHGHYPRWAFTPAFNAGEPRFLFYPPLSWTLGALLGLALPWTLVPAAFTWICLTLSGLSAYRLCRACAPPAAATVAAVLYLCNPYMLFTAYERTAYGELLAAAFLPLLFHAALRPDRLPRAPFIPTSALSAPHPARDILAFALPVALLWLANAPAAVMACYALAFLTLVQLFEVRLSRRAQGSPHLVTAAITTLSGTLLGLALSAFYLLPAAYERRFIQTDMAVIEGMRISDNTLFHHMPGNTPDTLFHDLVVRQASLVALTLLAAIALLSIVLFSLRRRHAASSSQSLLHASPTLLPLLSLTVLIAFFLTPLSLPLWNHTPELRFLQFPWRLTALLGPIVALLTALVLSHLKRFRAPFIAPSVMSVILAAALIIPAWLLFRQPCEVRDTIPTRVALFHSDLGTEATDEYTPLEADADALRPHDPPYWLVPAPPAQAEDDPESIHAAINSAAPAASPHEPGPAPDHLTLNVAAPTYLILNLREYPSWHIEIDHTAAAAVTPERDDGLITLLLSPGRHTVELTLHRTADETAGLLLSLLAAATCLTLFVRCRKAPPKNLSSPAAT